MTSFTDSKRLGRRLAAGMSVLLPLFLSSCSSIGVGGFGGASGPVFEEAAPLGEGREWRPYPVVVDFNNDGHLDIVATHRRPLHLNSLHVWLGRGDGSFEDMEQNWHSPGYSGLAVGDIGADGHLDIVAASHFLRVQTFLNDRKGGMNSTVVKTSDGYQASRLVDLDSDGKLDLVLLGYLKAGLEVYKGDGKGNWSFQKHLIGGIGRDLEVVDLNKDGRPDIVASMGVHGVVIFLQQQDGSWSGGQTGFFSATKEFRSLAVADVDNNGHLDIVLNGGYQGVAKANGPDVYLADGSGNWKEASEGLRVLGIATEGIAAADFDRDGFIDIVAGGSKSEETGNEAYGLFAFRGNGKGKWRKVRGSGLPSEGRMRAYGMAIGDFNEDGLDDVVVAHGATATVDSGFGYLTIWLNRSISGNSSD